MYNVSNSDLEEFDISCNFFDIENTFLVNQNIRWCNLCITHMIPLFYHYAQ